MLICGCRDSDFIFYNHEPCNTITIYGLISLLLFVVTGKFDILVNHVCKYAKENF